LGLKDFRRIATRYDRLASTFLAAICLAATVSYWLSVREPNILVSKVLIGGVGPVRNVLSATMVFLTLYLSTGVAVAQQPTQAQRDEIRNSCRSDFMSNCSSVTPGGAEALRCLQQNSARLSGACRNAVNAIGPPPAQPASTPAAPTAAAPTTAPATAHPTPAARTAKAPAMQAVAPRQVTPGRRAAIRTACQTDFIARCPGVQPGGAQALQCLQGHAPELAFACRSALAVIAPSAAAPPVVVEPVAVIGPIPPLPLRVRLEILNICRAEQISLCGDVPAGGGRLVDCLVANQASISPGCRRALLWAGSSAPSL
jgi:hypothetical protein